MSQQKIKEVVLTLGALAGIAIIIKNAYSYLFWPGFIDHGEINMTTVSWLLYEGSPLYTTLDAPERYSLEHGPIVYLVIGGILKLFGPSIFTAKLSGVCSLLAVLIVSWFWFKHFVNPKIAFWLVGLEALILAKWYNLYLNRPDSLMVLCTTVGMYFITTRNRSSAILGTIVSLGILVNLKADGVFPAIPILVLLFQKYGWKDLLLTLSGITVVGLLPFALPNISLINYIHWLMAATSHGLRYKGLIGNLLMVMLLLLLPLSIGYYFRSNLAKFSRNHRLFIVTLVMSLLVVAVIGSKPGSGSNHLTPFIPLVMYLIVAICTSSTLPLNDKALYKANYILITMIALTIFITAFNGHTRLICHTSSGAVTQEMVNDFNYIRNKYYNDSIMMGYGNSDTYTQFNPFIPLFAFVGNPYLVDACALMDMQFSGLAIPETTIKNLKEGKIHIWLIPKGNTPFSLLNWYNGKPLFDKNFQQTFLTNYKLVEHTHYFDVWYYIGSDRQKISEI